MSIQREDPDGSFLITKCGKQILVDGKHLCDAANEGVASALTVLLGATLGPDEFARFLRYAFPSET